MNNDTLMIRIDLATTHLITTCNFFLSWLFLIKTILSLSKSPNMSSEDSSAVVMSNLHAKHEDVPEPERKTTSSNLLSIIQDRAQKRAIAERAVSSAIENKVLRDKSPEAKAGRRRMLVRAVYGEFICSILFYTPIFCCIVNGTKNNWSSETISFTTSLVAGFQAVGISFAFSSVSGAQFNSAVSFALWLTKRLSNRRAVLYIIVQLVASIVGMIIVTFIFDGDLTDEYKAVAVYPADGTNLAKVFATEFFLTFMLTYTAFTVAFEDAEKQKKENMSVKTISDSKGLTVYASNPQSRTGFAPFSIGFTIFALGLCGGASGGAFNPGRLFGPAIFANKWKYIYLYWLGELSGAATAGLLVTNLHKIGLTEHRGRSAVEDSQPESVEESLEQVLNDPDGEVPMTSSMRAEMQKVEQEKQAQKQAQKQRGSKRSSLPTVVLSAILGDDGSNAKNLDAGAGARGGTTAEDV